jgi:hypothetical protein
MDAPEELPPSLQRALVETGDYALRLRTGEVVRFTRAERHGSFVALFAPAGPPPTAQASESMAAFPHGLEVRVSDIVWCARGPAPGSPAAGVDLGAAPESVPGGVRVPLRITSAEP